MPRILTKREKLFFIMAMAIIFCSAVTNILIMPLIRQNKALDIRISVAREKITGYLEFLADHPAGQGANRSGSGAAFALSELNRMAKEANIQIVDLRPKTLGSGSPHKKSYFELRAECTEEACLKFIYAIQDKFSFLKIEKMQLVAKPNILPLEGNFSIAYNFPEEEH